MHVFFPFLVSKVLQVPLMFSCSSPGNNHFLKNLWLLLVKKIFRNQKIWLLVALMATGMSLLLILSVKRARKCVYLYKSRWFLNHLSIWCVHLCIILKVHGSILMAITPAVWCSCSVQLLSCVWLLVTPWTPGFPVHHQLLDLTQTHVHWVGGAIQPSHPLLSPSSPVFYLSQYQGLFKWVSSFFASGGQSIGVSASVSVLPMIIPL